MIKLTYLREEDYWIFPLSFFSIVGIAAMLYASVLTFRLPAAVLGLGLLLFTALKIKSGYSVKYAKIHIAITVILSGLLLLLVYSLTN